MTPPKKVVVQYFNRLHRGMFCRSLTKFLADYERSPISGGCLIPDALYMWFRYRKYTKGLAVSCLSWHDQVKAKSKIGESQPQKSKEVAT